MVGYVTLRHVTQCYIVWHDVMPHNVTLCYIMLCHVTLCYITLRHVTLRHVTLRHVTLRHTSSNVKLRHIMLHNVVNKNIQANLIRILTLRHLSHVTSLHVMLHDIADMRKKRWQWETICCAIYMDSYRIKNKNKKNMLVNFIGVWFWSVWGVIQFLTVHVIAPTLKLLKQSNLEVKLWIIYSQVCIVFVCCDYKIDFT